MTKLSSKKRAENAKEWIDVLKRKDYQQGYLSLFNDKDNGYCCLGVAMELNAPGDYDKHVSLDKRVVNFVGLKTDVGFFGGKVKLDSGEGSDYYASLVAVNDSKMFDFEQIGKIIETHVDELFKPNVAVELKKLLP